MKIKQFDNKIRELLKKEKFNWLGLTGEEYEGKKILTYINDEKYYKEVLNNKSITCIVTTEEIAKTIEKDKYEIIISNNPRKDFFELHNRLISEGFYFSRVKNIISEKAIISKRANIGKYNIIIEDNVIIEAGVTIYENVTIKKGTIIKSGTILGTDGFQYIKEKEEIIKVEPAGELEISENVVIHNNTIIDKGIFGKTFIGENTKIYNLVHVAHDSKIGKNVFLTAGVIVCGRVKIRDNSYLGPNCTVKNGLILGENSKVSMGSVVTRDVKDNEVVTGNFAIPHKQFIDNLKKM